MRALDDEHRKPLALVELAHDRKISRDHQRESERRLVEEQQPRPSHQRAGQGEHLLLAAGQRSG